MNIEFNQIMAKDKDTMTVKELAEGIIRVMRSKSDDNIAMNFSIRLCRDYPEIFEHLPHDLQRTILMAMEAELASFKEVAKSPK